MSHVCEIDLHIKDLDALKAACRVLGLEFREGQQTYKWFGAFVEGYDPRDTSYNYEVDRDTYGKCDHAVAVPDNARAYELGIVRRADGKGYALNYDPFANGYGLEAIIGKNAAKLRQTYAVEVAKKQARKQGFRVQERVQANGKVRLICTR